MDHKNCPSCKTPWEESETITQFFTGKYKVEGVPAHKVGMTVEEAAAHTAEAYGCTPETPRHFGKDVVGVETVNDRIEYWDCQKCHAHIDRFTGKETNGK